MGDEWLKMRQEFMTILQEEAQLEEIVRLVGMDALGAKDRWTMETAKSIREDYLHQNAFHEIDTYASLEKQFRMMKLILDNYKQGLDAMEKGVDAEDLLELKVKEQIGRSKYIPENEMEKFDEIEKELKEEMLSLTSEGGRD